MTTSDEETAFLQKFGVLDMAPVRREKPPEPLITPAEWEEIDRAKALRMEYAAEDVYLGKPDEPPLHANPLVCEIAEMLLSLSGNKTM